MEDICLFHVGGQLNKITLLRSAGMVMYVCMSGCLLLYIGREHMNMYEDGSCVPLDLVNLANECTVPYC